VDTNEGSGFFVSFLVLALSEVEGGEKRKEVKKLKSY